MGRITPKPLGLALCRQMHTSCNLDNCQLSKMLYLPYNSQDQCCLHPVSTWLFLTGWLDWCSKAPRGSTVLELMCTMAQISPKPLRPALCGQMHTSCINVIQLNVLFVLELPGPMSIYSNYCLHPVSTWLFLTGWLDWCSKASS